MSTHTNRLSGLNSSLAIKAPLRVATASNITLAGFQTIDGVTLAAGDYNLRVLVKAQTDGTQNGLWDAQAGAWTRCKDWDADDDYIRGSRVFVNEGAAQWGMWILTTADPIVLNTSTFTFASFATVDVNVAALDIAALTENTLVNDETDLDFIYTASLGFNQKYYPKNLGFTPANGGTLRSLQGKLRDFVTLRDFNCTANGIADDTSKINTAIASGAKVISGEGRTYFISGKLLFAAGVTFKDVNLTFSTASAIRALVAGNDCTFDNVHVTGSGTVGTVLSPLYQVAFDAGATSRDGRVPASRVTLRNCSATLVTVGVWLNGDSGDTTPYGWSIDSTNNFENIVGYPGASEGYGVNISPGNRCTVSAKFKTIRRHAVYLAGESSYNKVIGCDIDGTDNVAIQSNTFSTQNSADYNIIALCTIKNVTKSIAYGYRSSVGIGIYGKSSHAHVYGNSVSAYLDTGIDISAVPQDAATHVAGIGAIVEDNIVNGSTQTDGCIRVDNPSGVVVRNNKLIVADNTYGIVNGYTGGLTYDLGEKSNILSWGDQIATLGSSGAVGLRLANAGSVLSYAWPIVTGPGTAVNNTGSNIVVITTPAASFDFNAAVIGPASAVDARIPIFNGTSGKIILDSGFSLPGSSLVGITDIQTLTHKTFDAASAVNTLKNVDTTMFASNIVDIDGTLAANSDLRLATQKATKTYVDGIIAAQDAMVFKGVTDCSGNPNYPAGNRGDTYRVSVAGKIGGASGTVVEAGDIFICLDDSTSSGTQAAQGAHWGIIQTNIDGAVVGPASAVSGNIATFNGATGKILLDSGYALPTGSLVGTTDTQELTNKTLNASVGKGTWTASGTWQLPAFTLGGAVTGNGQNISGMGTLGSTAHTITSASATALAVGLAGTTNPALQVDASTASSATGLKVKSAAAAGGLALSVITSGTNENLTIDAAGSGTITLGGTSTGLVAVSRALTSLAHTITSASATALAVGLAGTTNPALVVDASTASSATGLKIKSAAAAGGLALSVITSGTNENLTLDAAGSGTITLGGTSTGAIVHTRATTLSAALTYGGVALSNAVTGTGNMVLSDSPTFTTSINTPNASISGTGANLTINRTTGTNNGTITFNDNGSTVALWGMAGTAGGLIAGTAQGDLAFRTATKKMLWSVDSGTTANITLFTTGGVNLGAPTGGDKGASTLNAAGSIYSNNTLLTCFGVEHMIDGRVDLEKWDGYASNGRHYLAHEYQSLLDTGFDPRDPKQYVAKLIADRAVPGMPSEMTWRPGDHSLDELLMRQWLALELLISAFVGQRQEVETRLVNLEAA